MAEFRAPPRGFATQEYERRPELLQARMAGTGFVDATQVVADVRMVKSRAEVARVRHIRLLASDTFDALPGLAKADRPLSSVFRGFRVDLLRRGADDVPYLVGGSGPGGHADVISPPTDDPAARRGHPGA